MKPTKIFFVFGALLLLVGAFQFTQASIDTTRKNGWYPTNWSGVTNYASQFSTDAKHGALSQEFWGIGAHNGYIELEKELGYMITRPSEEFSIFWKLTTLTPVSSVVMLRKRFFAKKNSNPWEEIGVSWVTRSDISNQWETFPTTFFVGQNFTQQYNKLKIRFELVYPPNSQNVEFRILLDYYHHSTNAGLTYLSMIDDFGDVVGIQNQNEIAEKFSLSQNYPNPFNPQTMINFQLPISSNAKLVVYDIVGREVEVLVNQGLNPGTYKVDWNANKFSSGTYFYRLTAGDYIETKKMIFLR